MSSLQQQETTKASPYAAQSAASSYKRARLLFAGHSSHDQEHQNHPYLPPTIDPVVHQASLERRRRMVTTGDDVILGNHHFEKPEGALVVASEDTPKKDIAAKTASLSTSQALARITQDNNNNNTTTETGTTSRFLVPSSSSSATHNIPTPTWHSPWKLSTVLSSHLGWVRSIAIDTNTNNMFATGSADRTIKIWNLPKATTGADNALMLTLTGHISAVRGLEFSPRHPYLFSCGEDKQVKCWDLETNQVVRHYHGHLSGVYCLKLHPTLDVMVTAGRDAVARVWDIRTKQQIHCLTGHQHTVAAVLVKSTHPMVITASHDATIKMWDLAAGKCFTTLTHHHKSIRALCMPSFENSFVSAAADNLRKWQGKDGRLLQTWSPMLTKSASTATTTAKTAVTAKSNVVVNAVAVNDDGVVISGGDDGSMHFWDYQTGYNFQTSQAQTQPGSLEMAENGIMACAFDVTGTRLITGEADKSIKIWKPDTEASELTHPVDMTAWRKKCIAQSKQRY